MPVDIGQELYEQIKAEFDKLTAADGFIKTVAGRISAGTATMEDVSLYAQQLGVRLRQVLGDKIRADVLPNGQMYYNIAEKILGPILHDNYDLVNQTAADVQRILDKRHNINIKPQKAAFPDDRVQAICNAAKDQEAARAAEIMGRASDTVSRSFADDYMEENAKFRSKAGFQTYIVRATDGKCCEWCSRQAGKYSYPDATPHEVFQRHDNCGCTVTYENGGMRQDVWSKRTWEATPEELAERKELEEKLKPVRFTPEQAAAKEGEVLEQRAERLTNVGESGIIIAKGDIKNFVDSMPSEADAKEFISLINNCNNEDVKRAYRDYSSKVDIVEYNSNRGGESYYRHAENKLVYSYPTEKDIVNGDSKFSSISHECGHLFDAKGVFDGLTFEESDALNSAINASFVFKRSPSGSDQFLAALRADKVNLAKIVMKEETRQDLFSTLASGGVQDALDGLFGERVRMLQGHGDKYYNDRYNRIKSLKKEKALQTAYKELGFDASNQAKVKSLCRNYETASELWANITSAETCGGADLEYIKKYLPNSYASFISIMKGLR